MATELSASPVDLDLDDTSIGLQSTFDSHRLKRARVATSAVFVLLGLFIGLLAARMPAIKHYAGLSDGALGLALLGMPAGSIAAIQLAGRLIARWGSSRVVLAALFWLCAAAVTPPFASSFPLLLGALILFGAGVGLIDTAVNAHAVVVQRLFARSIMSSFHGFASLGMLVGAVIGSATAHWNINPQITFLIVAVAGLLSAASCRSSLLPASIDRHAFAISEDEKPTASHRAPWTGTLILLAVTAFLALLAEWAVGNWSAVYASDSLGASGGVAACGFVLFSLMMVCARFLCDGLITRLGPSRVVRYGGLLAGVGFCAGLSSGTVVGVTLGWGLVGIGMSGVVPIVFSAAGNIRGMAAGGAISKVVGVGYSGSMIGPPMIGLLAEVTTLRTALYAIVVSCLIIGVIGPSAVRRATA